MTELPTVEDPSVLHFRMAQARRLLRFCGEAGLDPTAVIAGRVTPDLSSICDEGGRVIPDDADLAAVQWRPPRRPGALTPRAAP